LYFRALDVGLSSGWKSFTGLPEAEELRELVSYALKRLSDVCEVVPVGYSNGALTASLHPVLPVPLRTTHVLISYPLGPCGFSPHSARGLTNTRSRILCVTLGPVCSFALEMRTISWVWKRTNEWVQALTSALPPCNLVAPICGCLGSSTSIIRVVHRGHFSSR
ncbi:hypothetical protein BGW80DRAFT_1490797, partial [Lactifluus volemus]